MWAKTKVATLVLVMSWSAVPVSMLGGGDAVSDNAGPQSVYLLSFESPESKSFLTDLGMVIVDDYNNDYYLAEGPLYENSFLADFGIKMNALPDRNMLRFPAAGITFDTNVAAPTIPPYLTAVDSAERIVQFLGPIKSEWIAAVESRGVPLRDYVENYAYIGKMNDEQAAAVRSLPFVGWVGQYQPAYKIESRLLQMSGAVEISLTAYEDVDEAQLITTLGNLGAYVLLTWPDPTTAVALVDTSLIPAIAKSSAVSQIFLYQEVKTLDWEAGEIHKFHQAWTPARSGLPTNLTGHSPGPDGIQGNADDVFEIVGIQDTGLDLQRADAGHHDFFKGPLGDRVIAVRKRTAPCSQYDGRVRGTAHGTHVSGTVISNGWAWEQQFGIPNDDFVWDQSEAGVVPEGKLSFDCVITASGTLQSSPTYWDDEYADGAKTMSNSYGSSPGPYGPTAVSVDTRIEASNDKMILFAAGNDGPDPATTSTEAKAKNGLTIGASENYRPEWFDSDNSNLIADFSSRSDPAERFKPDLLAIGTSVIAPLGCGEWGYWSQAVQPDWIQKVDVYSCNNPGAIQADGMGDYRYMPGTSAATPMAAGLYMLTREYFREVWGIDNVNSQLAKAMLINGAVRMDPNLYQYPGIDQGWGRIDLEQSLFPPAPRTNQFEEGVLTTTGTWQPATINKNVETADVPLKITLVWVDPPAVGGALVRNLDLIVRDPSGTIEYHGNQYGTSGALKGWTDSGDPGFDNINNVEQVEVQYPATGLWTVIVRGTQVPSTAKFAVIFSADVGPKKTYQVHMETRYPTVLSVSPDGAASLPFSVRNYGTETDIISISHGSSTIGVTMDWMVNTFTTGQMMDNMAIMYAPPGTTPGMYSFCIKAESGNDPNVPKASDTLCVQVEVLAQRLPYWWKVTTESVDELDPSVVTFNLSGTYHVFIAYRKTTPLNPLDLSHNGTNVWVAHNTLTVNHQLAGPWTHMVVSDWNDYPNDLRFQYIDWGLFTGRVILTWTGKDPLEPDDNKVPWGRVAFSDSPYDTWNIRTMEKNYGSNVCNSGRVSFPIFRHAGGPNGTLAWIWEHLDSTSYDAPQISAVQVHATFSFDGGDTWSDCVAGQCKKIAPPTSSTNFYFFPNGGVDQNDVLWVFFYWRTATGSAGRKLALSLWDGPTWDTGWLAPINIWDDGTLNNIQYPAVVSTPEGGNRVYVAATNDKGRLDKQLFALYAEGNYGSGLVYPAPLAAPSPGLSPSFASPRGPFGVAVSDANYNRRPVLNIVYTDDGIVWIPYMELGNPYGVPNMWTWSSRDGFATAPNRTLVSADAFAKGHQMSDTLTTPVSSCVYEVWHENIAPSGEVNYDVYLAIYCAGWDTTPDNLGPSALNLATLPNPVNRTFPSPTFKIKADISDINTGYNNIIAAQLLMTDLTVTDPSTLDWSNAWSMNLTGVDRSPTETAWLYANWLPSLWSLGECRRFWIRGEDNKSMWGQGEMVDVCVTQAPDKPPPPPVMQKAELTGTNNKDVTLTWSRSLDDGAGANDVSIYKVWKSDAARGTYFIVYNVTATGASAYSWTDINAGHGNMQFFFYYVQANDSVFDSLPTKLAAKFFRTLTDGDSNLLSVPLYQANYHPNQVLKTIGFTSVRTYYSLGGDPWRSYKPGRAINDISAMDVKSGYWVKLTAPGTMTVAGLVPDLTTMTLPAGWNLIGFPSFRTNYTLGDFAAAAGGSVHAVETYDSSAGPYYLQRLAQSEWSTTCMQAGQAYWILLSSAVTWYVPGT